MTMHTSKTILAVALALLCLTGDVNSTGYSWVPQVQADTLPAVWQRKLQSLIKNINTSMERLDTADPGDFADDFKAKQWRERVENYRTQLDRVPASEDPLRTQAGQALAKLESGLAARLGGSAAAPAAAPPTAASAPAAAPRGVESKPEASAAAPAQPSGAQAGGDVRPLVSGERVRVKKLTRDMQDGAKRITGQGPSPLQDPEIVAQRKKSLEQFTAAIKRYPQASDPDVIAMRAAYSQLAEKLKTEYARAQAQLEIVGDAFARLEQVENRGREYPVPEPLSPPFTREQAQAWLDAGSKARTAAEFDMKQLQEIGPNAYLPDQTVSGRMARYNAKDIDRLARTVRARFDAVQQGYVQSHANIDTRLAELDNQVQSPKASDPAATTDRHLQALDQMVTVAQSAVHLENVLQRPVDAVGSRVEELRARRVAYDREREALIDAVRMPEPARSDPEMVAIAEEILEKPRYEFGPHGPIVITSSQITTREKKSSEIDIDKVQVSGSQVTMSGTETTWTYKWREFQFATALREGRDDLWRIHHIMAKYYTSGSESTPLNVWISGGVVEGDLIRESAVFE